MKLTVYYDGQFWIGVIEVVIEGKLRAVRHLFGKEPKDSEVFAFCSSSTFTGTVTSRSGRS